jgi:hypothetical protein
VIDLDTLDRQLWERLTQGGRFELRGRTLQ